MTDKAAGVLHLCGFLRYDVPMTNEIQVPEKIVHEMQRMKAYFPARIVFAVLDGEWRVEARLTRAAMNNYSRKGIAVAQLQYE